MEALNEKNPSIAAEAKEASKPKAPPPVKSAPKQKALNIPEKMNLPELESDEIHKPVNQKDKENFLDGLVESSLTDKSTKHSRRKLNSFEQ